MKDLKNFHKKIDELKEFIKNDIPTIIGTEALKFADDNFRGQGFDGNKWQDRKNEDKYPHSKLVKDDNLRSGLDYEIKGNKIEITGDVPYANIHNRGVSGRGLTAKIPKRQFIGDSQTLRDNINNMIKYKLKNIK